MMGKVTVSRGENNIVFRADDAYDLAVLYERLEQNAIAFTSCLSNYRESEITAYLNQGDDVDAWDKELYLDSLASEYNSDEEEEQP